MSVFVVTLICVGIFHACSNYASHKSVAQAIANGLEWVLFSYLFAMALLVIFLLVAVHAGWLTT